MTDLPGLMVLHDNIVHMPLSEDEMRRLFGEMGDCNPLLAELFGCAYLDHEDKSADGIPSEIARVAEVTGGSILQITDLVQRAVEQAKIIDCKENQAILTAYITAFIENFAEGFPQEAIWANIRHMEKCFNPDCRSLELLSRQDKYLSQEQMRIAFEQLSVK